MRMKALAGFRSLSVGALVNRGRNSTVVWSWISNILRLAIGIFLLPLVLHKLSTAELGMYYILLGLVALAPVIDFGFSPTIVRFVSYAMAGAETIQAHGFSKTTANGPNLDLLWKLFFTTRALYRYMALAVLVLLGAWGTFMVELRIHETPSVAVTRVAWVITLLATTSDIYSNWALIFLRGMNEVLISVKISVVGSVIKFLIASVLLFAGGGLLSLPIGTLVGNLIQQRLARRACRQRLGEARKHEPAHVWENLRIIWPNSWRLGLSVFSSCMTAQANTAICVKMLGLTSFAPYALSGQLVGMISGMAMVWTTVKWQLIGQFRARHDYAAMRLVLWPRFWLQTVTFVSMVLGLLICGPPLLKWFGSGKQLLPPMWLVAMITYSFLELHLSFWASLISTENRVPFLWPGLITTAFSLGLSLTLIHVPGLGIGALVLAPLLAGCVFNYWYWPLVGARTLNINYREFLVSPPKKSPTEAVSPV
jgi:O-antigen/teichoic acid export membrane protein